MKYVLEPRRKYPNYWWKKVLPAYRHFKPPFALKLLFFALLKRLGSFWKVTFFIPKCVFSSPTVYICLQNRLNFVHLCNKHIKFFTTRTFVNFSSTCTHHYLPSSFVTKRLTSYWCMQVLNEPITAILCIYVLNNCVQL